LQFEVGIVIRTRVIHQSCKHYDY